LALILDQAKRGEQAIAFLPQGIRPAAHRQWSNALTISLIHRLRLAGPPCWIGAADCEQQALAAG